MKTLVAAKLSALLLFIFSFAQEVYGNHASGGIITYLHLVGNQYAIRVTMYRDCTGEPAPVSVTVNISSSQCSIMDSLVVPVIGFATEYKLCPNETSTCQGGTQRGIQAWIFEGTYIFPGQCNDWLMSTIISGRATNITTIQHANTTDLYLEARLNNSTSDNSSPQFSNPVFDVLAGQQTVINFGFIDYDGDSLSYSLVSARSAENTNVDYLPTYSGSQPLTSIPPVSIDAVTGDIVFNAIDEESSVLALQINEFRNGIPMGSEIIDININTNIYVNNAPILYGWGQFTFYAGPGTMCLNFFSDDPDIDDSLTMIGNISAMPSATFTVAGNYHPTGTLCWDVDSSDVRLQPYTFTVSLNDNACPGNGIQIWSFSIFVTLDTTLINTDVPLISSIEENNFVFPNPFHHQAEIILSKTFANVESQFRIFNAMGKLMDNRKVNTSVITLKNENLENGIYLFELTNRFGQRSIGRFIIMN